MPHDAHAHHAPDHGHAGHHGHSGHSIADDGMGNLLELDADVLHAYWSAALDHVRRLATGLPVEEILDLGAGTGTAAIGFAQRFRDAHVLAADVEDGSLAVLRSRALDLGLAERVRTLEVDLDAPWPDLGTLDLTWASMSLHHLADPEQVLRDLLAITRTGGLLAVAEFPEPLRFLPEDLGMGRPGFESRALASLGAAHAESMPTLGSEWAPRIAAAGWSIVDEHEFAISAGSAHPDTARYARAWFGRLSHGLEQRLDADDAAVLAALLEVDGPHSLLTRSDLDPRGVRTVIVARKD